MRQAAVARLGEALGRSERRESPPPKPCAASRTAHDDPH
jgi:hypothetical protein